MNNSMFIEAESFKKLGGWVIDQQSIENIGSSYIMAHGLGKPVEDAETVCFLNNDGVYNVWVRTRNWSAEWVKGKSAGVFQIKIDSIAMPTTLGTESEKWAWQYAGKFSHGKGEVKIALHDLTGFNGRCDAVYISDDINDVPPNGIEALNLFRKDKLGMSLSKDTNEYDLVVAGGGVAGICCAISAIQSGLKVALIHNRNILGGCNSSEIRVSMGGLTHASPYMNLGNVVEAIQPIMGSGGTYEAEFYEDYRKQNIFSLLKKDMYKIAMNEHVISVKKESNEIKGLITKNTITGQETEYKGKYFADCTGDAVLARMMGAESMIGQESYEDFHESLAPEKRTKQVMGMSMLWTSKEKESPSYFPDIDWGINIDEDTVYYVNGGDWEWECGQYRNQAQEAEIIRDWGLMTVFSNWSYIKNHSKRKEKWKNREIDWVTPIGGKRESYRIVGDLVLTQNDIEEKIDYKDKTASMTWNIDLHFPDPENEEKSIEPYRSCAYHRGIVDEYPIPYRCLYSKNIKNLFLGGRILSVTHVAYACARVMRTLGSLGEVIGMAAAVCVDENATPKQVYESHLDKLISRMENGIHIPSYHGSKCNDSEFYHFKEEGHIGLFPYFSVPIDNVKICNKIKKLKINHKHDVPEF